MSRFVSGNAQPILVTGLPRSGTTWLARQLTRAPGLALAGREPMNPRAKQFALGGTLHAWTRLGEAATVEQRRTLRRVYQGREPRVYSRYGVRQWSAALPTTRLVVKDPFALLSLPLLNEVTSARPVILFRHPGALLASYLRMGWSPAVQEIAALRLVPSDRGGPPAEPPREVDAVAAMTWFWSTCYNAVLDDLATVPSAVLVDHAELARGGDEALRRLMVTCDVPAANLRKGPSVRARSASRRTGRDTDTKPALHSFDRTAVEVAEAWRGSMSAEDALRVEELTASTWAMMRERRLRLDSRETDAAKGMERR